MPAETAQTLDRGLRALRTLAAHPGGLTMSALSAELGINRTIVHRLISTLEQHALVQRLADGRLSVGLGALSLATAVTPVLRDAATPVLRELAEDLGCTTHLTIADGGDALALVVVEPTWTDLHVGYRVGARHPLTQGAAGKAILLGRGESTEAYVVTSGELQSGARGLAAPVLGVEGLGASIGIITVRDLDAEQAGPRVTAAAAVLARRLGGAEEEMTTAPPEAIPVRR